MTKRPQLVITAAHKQELPLNTLKDLNIPIFDPKKLEAISALPDTFIYITGIGNKNCESSFKTLLKYTSPLWIINIGTCGGEKSFPLGEVVTPNSITSSNNAPIECQPYMRFKDLRSGPLFTSNSPRTIPENQEFIDMEAYFQGKLCEKNHIPFTCVKVISDHPTNNDIISIKAFKTRLPMIHKSLTQVLHTLFKSNPIEVSVIIPTFNRAPVLEKALQSIYKQTTLPKEVIVIDDGSTDHTADILRNNHHPLLKIITSDKNEGVSSARNKGIKAAKGNWIACLDSDDEWLPNKLQNQLQFLKKHPYYDILQSEEIWIRHNKRVNPHKHHKKPEGWIWEQSLERCYISPSSVLMKKSLFEKYGPFNENFKACEDYDLWLKTTLENPVGLVPSLDLKKYGGHDDQLSKTIPVQDHYRIQTLMELNNLPPKKKKLRDKVLSEKLKILRNGAKKRNKEEDVQRYTELLKQLA